MSRTRSAMVAVALAGVSSLGVMGAIHLSEGEPAAAAVPASGAPSLFVPIDAFRSMDTRIEAPVSKIPITSIGPVPRNATFGFGPISPVPDNATAITYNVTITETEGAGYVQVDRYSTADGSTSTINWTGDGQTHANGGVVQLEPADYGTVFGVFVGGAPNAQTHIIIDITGYYIPADAG